MIRTGMTEVYTNTMTFDFWKQKLENVDTIISIFSLLQCLDFFYLQHFIF